MSFERPRSNSAPIKMPSETKPQFDPAENEHGYLTTSSPNDLHLGELSSAQLTTFPLFSKLPIEMRRKIWKHALPPRPAEGEAVIIVEIEKHPALFNGNWRPVRDAYMDFHIDPMRHNPLIKEFNYIYPTRSELALLETCKESREVFLEVFKHALPTRPGARGRIRFEESTLIFCTDHKALHDYIELPGYIDFNEHVLRLLESITRLAVHGNRIAKMIKQTCDTGPDYLIRRLIKFKNLKYIALVCKFPGPSPCPEDEKRIVEIAKNYISSYSERYGLERTPPEVSIVGFQNYEIVERDMKWVV